MNFLVIVSVFVVFSLVSHHTNASPYHRRCNRLCTGLRPSDCKCWGCCVGSGGVGGSCSKGRCLCYRIGDGGDASDSGEGGDAAGTDGTSAVGGGGGSGFQILSGGYGGGQVGGHGGGQVGPGGRYGGGKLYF